MKKKYYTVYKITNKINNKIYIGYHSTNDLEDGYMGSGIKLNRAYKKYGMENFKKEILFIGKTKKSAYDEEIRLIREMNSINNNIGYNIHEGGTGGNTGNYGNHSKRFSGKNNPMYGKKGKLHHNYGKKYPPKSSKERKRLSERWKGEKNPNYGKRPSPKATKALNDYNRKRMGEKRTHYKLTDNFGNIYEISGEKNLKKFCKENNISHWTLVNNILKGKSVTKGTLIGWSGERVKILPKSD